MSKKTVSEIISSGNHYIIQVKGNQKNLYKQIRLNTQEDKKAISSWETNETKRGRQEHRKVFVYKNITGISPEWKGLQRLIRVERYVTAGGKKRHETAYYISSIRKNNAKYFGIHIRDHWGIENRLHWVKDVSMKEDTSRTACGMAAENISIIRNIAINIFRLNGFDSIKYATQFYANNFKELWRLISCKTINKKTI